MEVKPYLVIWIKGSQEYLIFLGKGLILVQYEQYTWISKDIHCSYYSMGWLEYIAVWIHLMSCAHKGPILLWGALATHNPG